ncbi:MAG: hypothetical protein KF892_10385 [Rhizobacter sp.]|nr:hypothetical protein [Rhizobacter sp.]
MPAQSQHHEIDHRTIKLLVGVIAITLSWLTSAFATTTLTSISAAYYEGGWSMVVFVGFLFAISALMLAYNGYTKVEMVLCKVAALCGVIIAMFPCRCENRDEIIKGLHGGAAIVLFLILAYLCWGFFQRARAKGYAQAKRRSWIYAACGIAMLLSIGSLAIETFTQGGMTAHVHNRFVFYGEALGLVAFGVSWLTASRTLPFLTSRDERFSPLRQNNPD